jgi:hypothetical protein
MKNLIIGLIFLVGAISAQAQSMAGLEVIMKEKVGANFKIVFTDVMKTGKINPTGSTLAAAQAARAGLVEGLNKAPSQLLNESGAIKDAASMGAFQGYQMAMRRMIEDMDRLIMVLADKNLDEEARLVAAKAQVGVIVRGQKKSHDEYKE